MATKSATKHKRESARDLFVTHGHSLNEIAEILGLDAGTLKRWSKNEAWENQYDTMQNLPNLIFKTYACAVEAMHRESQKPDYDTDVMTKRIAHVKSLEPSNSNYNDFIRLTADITAFVSARMSDVAPQIVEAFKAYSRHKYKHLYEDNG